MIGMSEDDERAPAAADPGASGSGSATVTAPEQYPAPQPDQVLENVLESVLCFLTSRRDRSAASLVCKSWWRAEALTRSELFIGNCYAVSPRRATARFSRVLSVAIKGKPRFADFNLLPHDWGAYFAPWAAAISQAYPLCLQKIYLKRMTVQDDDLALIACSLPHFQALTLVCCEDVTTAGLAVLALKARKLRVLDLIESDVSDEEDLDWVAYFPESHVCMESMIIDCVAGELNFESLERFVARSPGLKKLRLNNFISMEQLNQLMIRAPQLEDIGTGSFCLSDAMVQGGEQEIDYAATFAACKSLTCLSGFRHIMPELLPAIYPVCANLTSLNFSFANINADEFKPIISQCHNLEVFWVLDSICDEGLQAVAATCKKLRELRVFPYQPLEEAEGPVCEVGLQAISEGCRKLQSILYFCQRMTNAAVIAMSKNCPDLVVFRLCIMGLHRPDHETGQPMDEGFGAIVMNCKKLTRLAVSGLLTDQAFGYIGKYGKLVRTLSVAFAGDSDTGLKHVLEGCSNLQKLEIRDSPFGDEALPTGLHHYYNMRFMWMSMCKLTRPGCRNIAREKPRLVVEVMRSGMRLEHELGEDDVEILYMYRSLETPREDAPRSFVEIL